MNPLVIIGLVAVGAYFLFGGGPKGPVPAPPPGPPGPSGGGGQPLPGGEYGFVPDTNNTPLTNAILQMVAALQAHGYKKCDQNLYQAVQGLSGLTTDGYPGPNTMAVVNNYMAKQTGISSPPYVSSGSPGVNLPIYPWLPVTADGQSGQNAYDGTNAPLWSDWTGPCA